ncbi:uncharacterized protein BJ212DRAFT_346703 [Suillus subaureus]|uniref:Uncharacterized protein n=1 Tax=Suillus subaureus TaxID=48587 RepID=A0A9P7E8U8_9AGAM|nr:uncharacterized protein BJ212DRAFT_346703 [Suillus subaureus]KAG1814679.1 hypothetical protein BJ212DRAFT_346703 [Suillus subaureus]
MLSRSEVNACCMFHDDVQTVIHYLQIPGGRQATGPATNSNSAFHRHLSSAVSSTSGSPLKGSPRTFSSREDSDDEEESRIMFADGGRKDELESNDDEEGHLEDELITSFNGAQRCVFFCSFQHFYNSQKALVLPISSSVNVKKSKTKVLTGPLVILSKRAPGSGFCFEGMTREAARKRRAGAAQFIHDSAKASTGADKSVGGLGTRDSINSGLPNSQVSSLVVKKSNSTQARRLLMKRQI